MLSFNLFHSCYLSKDNTPVWLSLALCAESFSPCTTALEDTFEEYTFHPPPPPPLPRPAISIAVVSLSVVLRLILGVLLWAISNINTRVAKWSENDCNAIRDYKVLYNLHSKCMQSLLTFPICEPSCQVWSNRRQKPLNNRCVCVCVCVLAKVSSGLFVV